MKSLFVFDIDDTLAESKSAIDDAMATDLAHLCSLARVAIISGAAWPQFEAQVLARLPAGTNDANLSLLPTCGTQFYRYDAGDWKQLYAENLNPDQKKKIIAALGAALTGAGIHIDQLWGEQIEDRDSQITMSALGQAAPLSAKETWDPDFAKRKRMQALLDVSIPEFSVRMGGSTSIDVTLPGIDKAYGIGKMRDILGIPIAEMLYIGDALFPGGNDHPVRSTGARCIQIAGPNETKRVIETVVAMLAP
jgi:HAD superfamily hydrolase (TIGR01484 family)